AAKQNVEGRRTQKQLIEEYLRSIYPEGACANCIWLALGKPTTFPNGLSPRIGQKGGLIELGKAHYRSGVNCKRESHRGIDAQAVFYGPQIEEAFLEDFR